MPVRSLRSSVLVWPKRAEVFAAASRWAAAIAAEYPEVVAVLAMGSYARGDAGPGSDLDLVVVVRGQAGPPHVRSRRFDATSLPVPVDVIVLSEEEIAHHRVTRTRFGQALSGEALRLWPSGDPEPPSPG